MDPTVVLVSVIGAVPLGIGAWAQLVTARRMRTSNGRTLGRIVEDTHTRTLAEADTAEANARRLERIDRKVGRVGSRLGRVERIVHEHMEMHR